MSLVRDDGINAQVFDGCFGNLGNDEVVDKKAVCFLGLKLHGRNLLKWTEATNGATNKAKPLNKSAGRLQSGWFFPWMTNKKRKTLRSRP